MPLFDELRGLTALVTGASSGIGAETAPGLARFGASVVIHYCNNRSGAGVVASAIRSRGGEACLIAGDLSCPAGIDNLVNDAGSLIQRTKVLAARGKSPLSGDRLKPAGAPLAYAAAISCAPNSSRQTA